MSDPKASPGERAAALVRRALFVGRVMLVVYAARVLGRLAAWLNRGQGRAIRAARSMLLRRYGVGGRLE